MKNNLQSGEEVINRSKIHWVIFLNPFFILSLIMIATSNISPFGFHYLFLVLLIFGFLFGLVNYLTTEYILTNNKIIKKIGFIQRDIQELKLENIESIQVSQSILGRMLNYGHLYCIGIGSSTLVIYNINKPVEFKENLDQKIHSLKNNKSK